MSTPGPPPTHSSQNQVVLKAVIAAVLSTLVVAGILFYFFYRYYVIRRWKKNKLNSSFRREVPHQEFQQRGALKGLIVDENGLDVIYLRRFEGRQVGSCFSKIWVNHMDEEEEKRIDSGREQPVSSNDHIQEMPLLQNCSNVGSSYENKEAVTASHQKINSHFAASRSSSQQTSTSLQVQQKEVIPPQPKTPSQLAVVSSQNPPQPPIPPPAPPPPLPQPETLSQLAVVSSQNQPQPPILPPAPPPPPPPLPMKRIAKAPTPPNAGKIKPSPPPPPKGGGLSSSLKPPIAPRGKGSSKEKAEAQNKEKSKENGEIQVKLRPLHWDKVVANADHSMVWDEINNGSFRFEDDLMEVLFGYNVTSKRTPEGNSATTSSGTSKLARPTQMFILDPRKSQNTAIVLRSLSVSRKEILDALMEGQGLSVDTLEKLTKIRPTEEETSKILQFDGNTKKLADAESFLYQMLKSVPSAFKRFNAMLFRSSYDPEILNLKENQAGSSTDKSTQSLQLFAIVKDFLDMVDKVCVDITKKVQKRNASTVESSPPRSPRPRTPVRFHNLRTYFTPETASSESENDF